MVVSPAPAEAVVVSPAPAEAVVVSPAPVEAGAAEQNAVEPNAGSEAEKAAALEGLLHNLKTTQADTNLTEEEKKANAAFMEFIESIRVSAEEAKKLDSMGRDLQNGGAEPNLADGRSAKIEHGAQQDKK